MPDVSWDSLTSLVWPVVLVGVKEGEKHNLMTAAWVSQVSAKPALVMVSIAPGRYTHDILLKSGEFVLTVLSAGQGEACDICGSRSGRDTDKVAASGLKTLPAAVVGVPLIEGASANLECRLVDHFTAGDHTVFVGEVVAGTATEESPLVIYRRRKGTVTA
ncbi:MAG TPA: flavin reductase family protein [Spirochaetia bacterium]|nr:flavin reductase family protein [Spirochaetia bacterium]